ncbi:MAG: PEP-CTERM sorting domain-containing protein [Candidatus Omnitrophica bacterium]|nr:PEP-CTERM sorting domain-containing protein [Candidatus Omnitrophota bacterium]
MKKIFFMLVVLFYCSNANALLINFVEINDSFNRLYSQNSKEFQIFGTPDIHHLNDGSIADGFSVSSADSSEAVFDRAEINNNKVKYFFGEPISNFGGPTRIMGGDWSAQWSTDNSKIFNSSFSLGATEPIVLEAELNSKVAYWKGTAEVLSNSPSNSSLEHLPINANVGDFVPFELEYRFSDSRSWDLNTFNRHFQYRINGHINFKSTPDGTNVVPEPSTIFLFASGILGASLKRRNNKKAKKSSPKMA